MRYHWTIIRTAKIKNSDTTNAGNDAKLYHTHTADGNVKCYGHNG